MSSKVVSFMAPLSRTYSLSPVLWPPFITCGAHWSIHRAHLMRFFFRCQKHWAPHFQNVGNPVNNKNIALVLIPLFSRYWLLLVYPTIPSSSPIETDGCPLSCASQLIPRTPGGKASVPFLLSPLPSNPSPKRFLPLAFACAGAERVQ